MYENWERCEAAISGHKGAIFKKFYDQKLAQDFIHIYQQNVEKQKNRLQELEEIKSNNAVLLENVQNGEGFKQKRINKKYYLPIACPRKNRQI